MRTKRILLNLLTSFFPWIIIGILEFIKMRYFIKVYGSELNGLVQLVAQVFAYLSFAELGIGSALSFKYYHPLAKNDKKSVNALFNGSKYLFKIVGLIIIIGSFLASIILPFVIPNLAFAKGYVSLIVILYSLEYMSVYMLGLPYKTLLTSDQKMYKVNIISNTQSILNKSISLFLIIKGFNYIIIMIFSIIISLISNLIVASIAKKQYPWLNGKIKKDTSAFGMTKDVMIHKLSGLVHQRTDSIVISLSSGLVAGSIYSGYNYVFSYLEQILGHIYIAAKDSFGNLFSNKENIENKISIFNEFLSMTYFIAIMVVAIFIFSISPFITTWLGSTYEAGITVAIMFSVIIWFTLTLKPLHVIRNANGLYKETKGYTIIQALTNLILSIILVNKYKMLGVLFATIISLALVAFPFEVKTVYTLIFKKSTKEYYIRYVQTVLLLIITISIDFIVVKTLNLYTKSGLLWWIFHSGILGLITLIFISFIFYFFFEEFRNFVKRLFKIIFKRGESI